MKIAILILCHKNPKQINLFLDLMKHPNFTFFVHVDKKSDISDQIVHRDDVIVLQNRYRINVQWGKISQIDAILKLFYNAKTVGSFDFYWLCSGQDFPIKSVKDIAEWFKKHPDKDFVRLFRSKNTGLNKENNYDKRNIIYYPDWILGKKAWKRVIKRLYTEITGGYNHTFQWARREPVDGLDFYFGEIWFCLTRRTFSWILDYLDKHAEYYQFMKHCNCPDESFFHTLLMNSPYAEQRMDYLHYIDWSEKKNSPKTLCMDDLEKIEESNKLMARKFDMSIDSKILLELTKNNL